jgi:hypothetical protein
MAVGLLISPKIIAMIAITNSTCINPAAEYTNTPNAQPMIRTTATIYNNELMVDGFKVYNMFFIIYKSLKRQNVLTNLLFNCQSRAIHNNAP